MCAPVQSQHCPRTRSLALPILPLLVFLRQLGLMQQLLLQECQALGRLLLLRLALQLLPGVKEDLAQRGQMAWGRLVGPCAA